MEEPRETRSFSLSFPQLYTEREWPWGLHEYATPAHLIPHLVEIVTQVNLFLFIKQQLSVTQNLKRDDSCYLCFDLEFIISDLLSYEFVPYLIHVNQSFFLPFFFLRKNISEL